MSQEAYLIGDSNLSPPAQLFLAAYDTLPCHSTLQNDNGYEGWLMVDGSQRKFNLVSHSRTLFERLVQLSIDARYGLCVILLTACRQLSKSAALVKIERSNGEKETLRVSAVERSPYITLFCEVV
jgi:hypothetical protein